MHTLHTANKLSAPVGLPDDGPQGERGPLWRGLRDLPGDRVHLRRRHDELRGRSRRPCAAHANLVMALNVGHRIEKLTVATLPFIRINLDGLFHSISP